MLETLTLADTAAADDFLRSMDIAVGTVFVIALIFAAMKKANAPADGSDSSDDEKKS